MNKEMTEEELMKVTAGRPVNPTPPSDELSVEELDNLLAGAPKKVAYEQALEHPELFRESSLDALVEEQIKKEELEAQANNQLSSSTMRR